MRRNAFCARARYSTRSYYLVTIEGELYHRIRIETNDIRCQDCIVNYIGSCDDQNKPANCPICDKGPYKMTDLRSVQRRRKRINPLNGLGAGVPKDEPEETAITIGKVDLVSSTKLRALVRKLEVMRAEDGEFKALVFSQFTSFLGELL
jgi:DNA repair protein RAD5